MANAYKDHPMIAKGIENARRARETPEYLRLIQIYAPDPLAANYQSEKQRIGELCRHAEQARKRGAGKKAGTIIRVEEGMTPWWGRDFTLRDPALRTDLLVLLANEFDYRWWSPMFMTLLLKKL